MSGPASRPRAAQPTYPLAVGIVGRAANKQAVSLLTRAGYGDEQVVRMDVVQASVEGVGVLGASVGIVSDRAVYLVLKRRILARYPFADIAYASGWRPMFSSFDLVLAPPRATVVHFSFPKGDGGFANAIRRRLAALAPIDTEVLIGAQRYRVRYHPWETEVAAWWEVTPTPSAEHAQQLSAVVVRLIDKWYAEQVDERPIELSDVNWRERDWTATVTSLLALHGAGSPEAWSPCLHIQSDHRECPALLAATATAAHLIIPESMKDGLLAERQPVVQSLPYATLADWELCEPLAHGGRMLRLLIVDDVDRATLEDALQDGSRFRLALIGIEPSAGSDAVAAAIIGGVRTLGAYSPGTRAIHPLQDRS